jgi:hypothetical protein
MVGLPLLTLTIYLVWVWPWPPGASLPVELAPYLLSLATGPPFAWAIGRATDRARLVVVFLAVGFVLLWVYAAAILCGVRNVCL